MSMTGLGEVAGLATTVIEKIWPNKSEQEKAELQAALVVVQGQLAVNQVEAGNASVFVSGWRPFIGWVCGGACAWNWIGLSVVKTVALILLGKELKLAPADLAEMLPVLLGMLGLAGYRSLEKIKGVAR